MIARPRWFILENDSEIRIVKIQVKLFILAIYFMINLLNGFTVVHVFFYSSKKKEVRRCQISSIERHDQHRDIKQYCQ